MPNTNFVPNWTFERTLPSPFDSYSGKSAVMKDIASKYCNQPKKRATLHSATLQAVFSYMNLENPPAGKAEEELGAIGSQAAEPEKSYRKNEADSCTSSDQG